MSAGKLSVSFSNQSKLLKLNSSRVKSLCRFVLKSEKFKICPQGATLNLLFTDDEFITQMNGLYFNRNIPTDVISFPGLTDEPEPGLEGQHIGDVCIGLETALRQHKVFKTELNEEIALYIIHGILHLLGYTDIEDAHFKRMQDRQNAILLSLMQSPQQKSILNFLI